MFGSLVPELQPRTTSNSSCPEGTYTNYNGLRFGMHCSQTLAGNEIDDSSVQGESVSDCMEKCSRLGRPLCYGVTFDEETGGCSFKNSSTSASDLTLDTGKHSAMANAAQLSSTAISSACPYANESVQTTDSGMSYTVLCDLDVADDGDDYCPEENPMGEPAGSELYCGYWHADSLAQCAEWCSTLHPLCVAVSFNPSMYAGYVNCYPLSDVSSGYTDSKYLKGYVSHIAVARFNSTGAGCPSEESYTTGTGAQFELTCDQDRSDNTMEAYHDDDLGSCIDTCGSYPSCVGVAYDSNIANGFDNCYLKNATGVPTAKSNLTFARLTSAESSTTSPAASASASSSSSARGSSSSSSSSKAWIAGAVIGGLAAVLVLVGGTLGFTRRRARRQRQSLRRSSRGDIGVGGCGQGDGDTTQMPLVRLADGTWVLASGAVLEADNLAEVVEIGLHAREEPTELHA